MIFSFDELGQNPYIPLDQKSSAPVAQLDRATAFEAEGRGFESLRAHHTQRTVKAVRLLEQERRIKKFPRQGGTS